MGQKSLRRVLCPTPDKHDPDIRDELKVEGPGDIVPAHPDPLTSAVGSNTMLAGDFEAEDLFEDLRRIHYVDGSGSHIEPPLQPEWDSHTKLQWKAAAVAHDTGLKVRVLQHPGQTDYNIVVGPHSVASFNFSTGWEFLNGVDVGARALLAKQKRDKEPIVKSQPLLRVSDSPLNHVHKYRQRRPDAALVCFCGDVLGESDELEL